MIRLPEIDPVAFRLGPVAPRWYGIMYMLGFGAAWLLGRYRAGRPGSGWTRVEVDDLITWLVLGLVVGARLGYVLFYDLSHFVAHPLDVLAVWKGGMSFHGGAMGVALTGWIFARRTGKSLLAVGDFLTPLAPPGLFFGRMGNFINSELWGRTTDAPWGMVFPDAAAGPLPRHPSQLYEGVLEGPVLFAILWLWSSRTRPTGSTSALFLLGYGCFRFFVEFFRQPDVQLGYLAWGWLTMGQVLCLPMILLGGGLLAWSLRRGA